MTKTESCASKPFPISVKYLIVGLAYWTISFEIPSFIKENISAFVLKDVTLTGIEYEVDVPDITMIGTYS